MDEPSVTIERPMGSWEQGEKRRNFFMGILTAVVLILAINSIILVARVKSQGETFDNQALTIQTLADSSETDICIARSLGRSLSSFSRLILESSEETGVPDEVLQDLVKAREDLNRLDDLCAPGG